MEVRKESNGLKNSMVTREELAIINQFTKRALKEDEVYTFAVRLCDNEVDRDGERFPRATLEELAELFEMCIRDRQVLQGMMRRSAPMDSRRCALLTISGTGSAPPCRRAAVRSEILVLESMHTRGWS